MKDIEFSFTRERIFPGYDKKTCKVGPYIMHDGKDTAVLTYSNLILTSCDCSNASFSAISRDGGKSFGAPKKLSSLDGGYVSKNGEFSSTGTFCTYYNRFHKKWVIFAHRAYRMDDKAPIMVDGIAVCEPYYTFYNVEKQDWETDKLKPLPLPMETLSVIPHGQVFEYENGDMLVSFYVTTRDMHRAGALTARYSLDGEELKLVKLGTLLRGDKYTRGFCEPSVTRLDGKYYMTIRSDEVGLLSESDDGYTFTEPEPWKWDDGTVLENYNTMQRWIRQDGGLFLAYTRMGAHNDHVFRHRAPMFMARFDEDRKCLVRSSEVILVPELGARLGNYSVTEISEKEVWLTTAEWMQPEGCELYGSDNSIWIARVKFK